MSYTFSECNNIQVWNNFVRSSPQGNLFCYSYYFDLVSDNYKLFVVEKEEKDTYWRWDFTRSK